MNGNGQGPQYQPLFTPDEMRLLGGQGSAPSAQPAQTQPNAPAQTGPAPLFSPEEMQQISGQQAAAPSFGQQVGQQTGDFFTQAEKGILGTVQSASELVNKIPRIGPMLMPTAAVQAGRQAIQQMPEATTVGGKLGAGAEDIAEFVAGDEALKGMAVGEKLLQIGKVADYYRNAHPWTKAALDAGMNIMRTTAVGAGVGGLKGGAEGAETGAALGAAGGVAGEALGAAGRGVAKVARGLRDVPEPGLPPGPGFAAADTTQQDAHAGWNKIADDIAQDLGVKRTTIGDPNDPRSPTATRNILEDLSSHVQAEAKGRFKPLDDATDNEFTKVAKALNDNARKMRQAVDPDVEARLDEEAAALRVRLDEATELAKKNGVDPKLADEGNSLWKSKSATADLDAKLKIAMPGEKQAARPTIDIGRLTNGVQKMFDSGRLDDISGHERADAILQQAYESQRQEQLTEAARASREKQMQAAAKVREEAQAKVEQKRERLIRLGLTTAGGALGAGAAVKGVEKIRELTQ